MRCDNHEKINFSFPTYVSMELILFEYPALNYEMNYISRDVLQKCLRNDFSYTTALTSELVEPHYLKHGYLKLSTTQYRKFKLFFLQLKNILISHLIGLNA